MSDVSGVRSVATHPTPSGTAPSSGTAPTSGRTLPRPIGTVTSATPVLRLKRTRSDAAAPGEVEAVKRRAVSQSDKIAVRNRVLKDNPIERHGFRRLKVLQRMAKANTNLHTPQFQFRSGDKASDFNAAQPHRLPATYLKVRLDAFVNGRESAGDLARWTGRLVDANAERGRLLRRAVEQSAPGTQGLNVEALTVGLFVTQQNDEVVALRTALVGATTDADKAAAAQALFDALNSLFGNIPDFGPHFGINNAVLDSIHLHFGSDGDLTPGSLAALSSTPVEAVGVAVRSGDAAVVTTTGDMVALDTMNKTILGLMARHGLVSVDGTYLDWGPGNTAGGGHDAGV